MKKRNGYWPEVFQWSVVSAQSGERNVLGAIRCWWLVVSSDWEKKLVWWQGQASRIEGACSATGVSQPCQGLRILKEVVSQLTRSRRCTQIPRPSCAVFPGGHKGLLSANLRCRQTSASSRLGRRPADNGLRFSLQIGRGPPYPSSYRT